MKKGNLLIVDDEIILLRNLKEILKKHADEVFTASRALGGLEILEREEIHCVICDISMPGMNGVELLKAVRKKGIKTPFIFYTAYGDRELMIQAAILGAFDFKKKPSIQNLESSLIKGLQTGFKREFLPKSNQDLLDEYEIIIQTTQK